MYPNVETCYICGHLFSTSAGSICNCGNRACQSCWVDFYHIEWEPDIYCPECWDPTDFDWDEDEIKEHEDECSKCANIRKGKHL